MHSFAEESEVNKHRLVVSRGGVAQADGAEVV